jgi:Fic family protein
MIKMKNRAGTYVQRYGGLQVFIPNPLPPDPSIEFDSKMIALLSDATLALGRLDGAAENLPNPDLFVAMYVRKEAVLSSQIEGTQASLLNVLEYEMEARRRALPSDVGEVVNYIAAMNLGLDLIKEEPLSLDLLRMIHGRLLQGVRGSEWGTGSFRDSQNWIGPKDSDIHDAVFIPPPPVDMEAALEDLEIYIRNEKETPPLVLSGLVHAQFETIHPFLDGNGRMGRLLITFLLCQRNALKRPLLYLSYYLKKNQRDYYEYLMRIREKGDWESWMRFYLRGVEEVANQATKTTQRILEMQEENRHLLQDKTHTNVLRLYDNLFEYPIITIPFAERILEVTYPTARFAVATLCKMGILEEDTRSTRPKIYHFSKYLDILEEGTRLP